MKRKVKTTPVTEPRFKPLPLDEWAPPATEGEPQDFPREFSKYMRTQAFRDDWMKTVAENAAKPQIYPGGDGIHFDPNWSDDFRLPLSGPDWKPKT